MDDSAMPALFVPPTGNGMKTCTKCGESKPLDEFPNDKNRADKRFPHCKRCHSKYQRQLRSQRRDHYLELERKHRETAKRRYPGRNNHYVNVWRQKNVQRARAIYHRRRARQVSGVPQRWQIRDVLPFCCYWCGSNLRAYGATSHVDHVMPISLGGPAVPSNEVQSCAACNLRKGAKHPLVWIAELTA
ncbi:MAG: HNH endonuclease [Ilumatobacteraceae bacterium]